MIQTQAQLSDFLDRIKSDTHLAIDTEFKRVNTYYPLLCLVQIASDSAIDCIDVLAIKDLTPLYDKLYHPDTLWIVHSARQDIEALHYLTGQLPTQLFDTQIAACFLNHPMQVSYQALTESLQGVLLDKAYTRLDWTKRPLPDGAIEYALDDVRYLLKNYQQLTQQLLNDHKADWANEESKSLLDIELYKVNPFDAWKKVKGLSRLPKKSHQFAAQLSAWRESQAISNNKPRKWIMADDQLINYALKKEKLSKKAQNSLNRFLSNHSELVENNIVFSVGKIPTKTEKVKKKELQTLIQKIATQYNLDDKLIANSKALLNFIRGDQSVNFLTGWRHQLLKEELEDAK